MKVHAIGVSRINGTKNGRDYDMARLIILTPAESRSGKNRDTGDPYNVIAAGFDTSELDMKIDAFEKFKGVSYPARLDVSTESEFRFGRMQTVVADFSPEGGK